MDEARNRNLADLLSGIPCLATTDIQDRQITGISTDSRTAEPGNLFVAVAGLASDGHDYIAEAVARGCRAVVVEKGRSAAEAASPGTSIGVIEVADSRATLGLLATAFYDHPGLKMRMIAITGTNGKTTTSYLLESVIRAGGGRPGVIGTVSYRYRNSSDELREQPAPLTTPEPVALHRLLRQMADEGVTHAIMEVSSHALALKRTAGLLFDVAVFTNLSRDHLDFHPDMEHYYTSKRLLFCDHIKPGGKAVILMEPPPPQAEDNSGSLRMLCWGRRLADDLSHESADSVRPAGLLEVVCCGLGRGVDIYPQTYAYDLEGITALIATPLGSVHLRSALVGEFNLKNLLAALGAGICLGLNKERIRTGLEQVRTIPGRLERVESEKGVHVFVDYAHTPDALENVLHTLRRLKPARLICLFGCGGDRDPGKRSIMGQTAGRLADVVLATSDNPRSEPPEKILAAIESGLLTSGLKRMVAEELLNRTTPPWRGYDIIVSRREAIRTAVHCARTGDVVLIAGKGHENYQITNTGKIFFNDRLEAEKYLREVPDHV